MRRFVAVLAALLGWVACNPTPPLGPHPQEFVGTGNEPSITFVPGIPFIGGTGLTPPRTLVMFNGGFNWSSTTDGSTWSPTCAATTTPGPCFVPMVPTQTSWNSDPFVATAPSPVGQVVAVSHIGGTANNGTALIVVSVSIDGGATFISSSLANDTKCGDGNQDQPALAFDPNATDPTVWVVWRHRGAATYGICVRGGVIDPNSGNIAWIGPPHEVQNVNNAPFYGAGGVLIQPLGETVTVMYTNTDNIFKDCSGGKDVKWYTNTSFDSGVTWSDSKLVFEAPLFSWCTLGNHYIRGIRSFWFERDHSNSSVLWAVVNDSQDTAQIMFSSDEGVTWTPSTTAVFPSMYEPVLTTDPSGRVAVFFLGSDPEGANMTPFIMDRRLGMPDPIAWAEPQQAGNTFPSIALQACDPGSCPPVFNGDSSGSCVNHQCVGQRFGGGGDYLGITVVPAGTYGDSNERFAPAWQDSGGGSATSSTSVQMSFVDVLQ